MVLNKRLIRIAGLNWSHVKEIPNTRLLISLNHNYIGSAKMEIFDLLQKQKARKIYSFGEPDGTLSLVNLLRVQVTS